MIGNKFLSVTGGEPTDAQFNYVTMLLHGDGTNGAQNNTFLDSSTNNFTITRNGNTTQGSFSPYGSNWANYFGGSGTDYLSVASAAPLNFGTGDFTVEMWVNPTSLSNTPTIWHKTTGAGSLTGWNLSLGPNLVYFGPGVNAGEYVTFSVSGVSVGTWAHIAITRVGSTLTCFVNGTKSTPQTLASASSSYDNAAAVQIGGWHFGTFAYDLNGYMSNVRVTKGAAIYTVTFTPSTTPLTTTVSSGTVSLLTCQSNRFVDNSSNAYTVTANGAPSVQRFNPFGTSTAYSTSTIGGSGYFDGTGDYLSVPTNTAFAMGTGDFTLEAWVYATAAFPLYGGVIGAWGYGTSSDVTLIIRNSTSTSGKLYVEINGVGYNGTAFVYLNRWTHIAVTRSGTTLKTFVDGAVDINTTNSANIASTYAMTVNGSSNGNANSMITGYIADARVVKGGALYTAAFTPPTAPLTTTVSAGTVSLLANMTNGAIYDNAMMNDLETVGNAQISTSVKKYGTGSLYFDGTGDYLVTPYQPTTQLGSGNFTIEFWIYFNSVASGQQPLGGYKETAINWGFYITSSGTLSYYLSSNGTAWNIASNVSVGSISTGQWYHVALVRNGSTFTPYLNGVAGTTTTNSSAIYANSDGIYIGAIYSGYGFNGYIDDLRITKGYARYTTTFTPPTAALPDKGPISS